MFVPSGRSLMTSTLAPVAARIPGATALPEPFARVEDDPDPAAADRRGETGPVGDVAGHALAGIHRDPQLVVADAAELLRPPDQLLELVLDGVVELQPVVVEDLQAVVLGRVVGGRDHDPGGVLAAARRGRRGRAWARRRPGGRRVPRLVAPAVIAATNRSHERRVSWPTTIAPRPPTSRWAVARPRA